MTHSTLLTNSQEEALLSEYWSGAEEMKEFAQHLDIDYPLSNLDQLNQQSSFLQPPYDQDQQDTSIMVDNKMLLQQQLAVQQQQYLQHQQQHQQQQQQQQQQPQQQQQQPQQQPQQFVHQQLQQQQPPTSVPTPIQAKEEFPGDYNFQVIINNKNTSKHWVYSEKLQKIFINMEQVLPLQFSWDPPEQGLLVRATMVYKHDQHRSSPVFRCHNHMAPDNNSNRNIEPDQVEHVIRSTHSASKYEKAQNNHLSVVTPLGIPEPGVNDVPMDFVFYCKNSCSSGMNRRATELIFTLETHQKVILGRKKLEIRVCSCPKRDKEKEEGEMQRFDGASTASPATGSKKRKMVNTQPIAPPPGKRPMPDMKVFNLNLNVVGRDNYNAILKYAEDVMLSAGVRSNNLDGYKPYVEDAIKKRLP